MAASTNITPNALSSIPGVSSYENSVDEGLRSLQKSNFDPENIGAEAKRKLIFQNLVQQIAKLAEEPSEAFVRLLLQNAGLSHVRTKALAEYSELARSAFREFVNLRIPQRLDLPVKDKELDRTPLLLETHISDVEIKRDDGIVTTQTELDVINYVKRRLYFLTKEDHLFDKIDKIEFRDYKGKFVVFFKKERAGRLFDFSENGAKRYTFDFGLAFCGEISTDKLADIDNLLMSVFSRRIEENKGQLRRPPILKVV